MIKTLVLVMIASTLAGSGHVMLSKGMKTIGDMTEAPSSRVLGMAAHVASNPWVLLGVLFQASFFVMYLVLLSRADVTKVLPLTAMDYIVVSFLAPLVVAETITPTRWIGILLIVGGVTLVSRS